MPMASAIQLLVSRTSNSDEITTKGLSMDVTYWQLDHRHAHQTDRLVAQSEAL